jgi:phosphoserine phosphatase
MFIATLIAADRLTKDDLFAAGALFDEASIQAHSWTWVEEGSAADFECSGQADEGARIRAAIEGKLPGIDVVVQRQDRRRRRLLIADMDSTMIAVECIDELADYAGVAHEIAAITEQAMRGELAFEAALEARVALLAGLDEAAIERCHDERVRITAGAVPLVRTMRAHGAYCLLVSGGFSRFADRVAAEIGFDRAVSNRLGIRGGRLAGTVARPIVGAQGKRRALVDACAAQDVPVDDALAVGDGANDVPMSEAAGLGIAYHAKPAAAAAADARIVHNDLSALLYAQGCPRREWESD